MKPCPAHYVGCIFSFGLSALIGCSADGAKAPDDASDAGASAAGTGGSAGSPAPGAAGSMAMAGTGGLGGLGTGGAGAPSGGSAGSAGKPVGEPGYGPAPREIMITPGRGDFSIEFEPSAAAPGATTFHGKQKARFDESAPRIQKKLVIGLGGIDTGPANGGGVAWAGDRGYHTLGIDYFNKTSGQDGLVYLETWSGEDTTAEANVSALDCIMNRVKTGLVYLQAQDPGADWAYYLDQAGDVRWNDVIVFGYSYGGQTGAAATKYVALHRLVATSSPHIDDTATWVSTQNVTSGYRSYAISGTLDGGHAEHMETATRLGWPGQEVATWQSSPPYDDSSLLAVDFGHSEFCSLPEDVLPGMDALCEFAFGYAAP